MQVMQAVQSSLVSTEEDPSPNRDPASQSQQPSLRNSGNSDTCARDNPWKDKESKLQAS